MLLEFERQQRLNSQENMGYTEAEKELFSFQGPKKRGNF